MDVPLNVKVYCVDGLCGQSTELILDRTTDEVTHLVVKRNHLPHTELLVPVELISETTAHQIRLRCTIAKLAELEPFLKDEIIEEEVPQYLPDPDPYLVPIQVPETRWVTVRREAIPPSKLAVRRGARIEATDGHVGQLTEFLVDPVTEQVTHLVLREGHLWGRRDVRIPVSEIDRFEENTVHLKLDKGQVEALAGVPTGLR